MKIRNSAILVVVIMMTIACLQCHGLGFLTVSINGDNLQYDSSTGYPYIDQNGRTMVPLRATLEGINAAVRWDENARKVIGLKDGIVVEIPIGEKYVLRNGEVVFNDTEAVVVSGRTYIPIRVVMESFGYSVRWDSEAETIEITRAYVEFSPNEPFPTIADLKNHIKGKNVKFHGYYSYGQAEDHEKTKETLYVKDLDAPCVILISAYEPIEWNVVATDPTDIVAICLEGYYPQTLSNKEYPYFSHSYVMGDSSYYLDFGGGINGSIQFAEDVKDLYGIELGSIWFKDNVIDGVKTAILKPVQTFVNKEIVLEHEGGRYFDNSIAPYPKNIAGYTGVWWDSNFKANQGYLTGKYYFETKVTVGNKLGVADWTNLGIGTDTQYGDVMFYDDSGRNGEYAYGAIDNPKASTNIVKRVNPIPSSDVRSGDIIGVAMDLDNGRVYFSLNGVWQNGDPTKNDEGQIIVGNRVYYAKAAISCVNDDNTDPDQIQFAFNKSQFKYVIPAGYEPYGRQ